MTLKKLFGQRQSESLFDEKKYAKIQRDLDKQQKEINKLLEKFDANISTAA